MITEVGISGSPRKAATEYVVSKHYTLLMRQRRADANII